ncbi:MAG: hypothetical protein JRI73_12995 [Deltaproteobacteria bacterium]|nr:hypothetical protein [Deltaproteobacteria bacterium]
MYDKRILNSSRVRKIQGSFSWIDHRFITGGFLRDLSAVEILLYFFLVTVSDRNGISFYHDDRICSLIKIGLVSLGEARDVLVSKSLLAYEYPIYQILSLPPQPLTSLAREEIASEHMRKIREVLK